MTAISEAIKKLEELKGKSTLNKEIYGKVIASFTPAEGGELSNEGIVNALVLLAQAHSDIQELKYVPSFFHSNGESRRVVLELMIKSIMKESFQKVGFVDAMNTALEAKYYPSNLEGSEKLAVLAKKYHHLRNEVKRTQVSSNTW